MSKITPDHLSRSAIVYIRQSTSEQLKFNAESRRRQYGLQERARALGWSDVVVIDEDLGRSGSGIVRPGFERLLASVCRGTVGAVVSIEASRLARNGRDWHTLLEFCGLVGTLIVDEDGIYDPRHPNDRLLLGMKGTMSELELSLLRQRSHEAIKLKAGRGELFTSVPIGYVRTERHRIERDPDRRVRAALELVFRKFMELQSVRQVHVWLRQEHIDLPFIEYTEAGRTVRWRAPMYSTVHRLLRNPIYAGAYVYGRSGSATRIEGGRKRVRRGVPRQVHEWDVLLKEHHEGYISWERFEQHQRMIMHNNTGRGAAVRGPIRRGESLLAGMLRCGHCGRKLHVTYSGKRGSVIRYHCRSAFFREGPASNCIHFGSLRVEAAVVAEVLRVLKPEGLEAAIEAADAHVAERDEKREQLELSLTQARFEVSRAKRQYDAVDPENRLVAAELERRWNERLAHQRHLEEQLTALESEPDGRLSELERRRLMELGHDIDRAWHHPAARPETRKRIIRAVLTEIVVRLVEHQLIELTLHWRGGDHTRIEVIRNKTGQHRWATPADVKVLIEVLARQTADRHIAAILNRAGKRTARGHTWTEGRVRAFRNDHSIAVYRDGERAERGEVTLEEAADLVKVNKMRLLRLIREQILPASQFARGTPWIINRADLDLAAVRAALEPARSRPVTPNSDQSLFYFSET
jgi:DNA invertase Pin-like site-specific DNA recombinase